MQFFLVHMMSSLFLVVFLAALQIHIKDRVARVQNFRQL
jgi:hypothetical protein